MANEARHIDIGEMVDAPAWLALVDEVRKTGRTTIVRAGGEDAVEIRPVPRRHRRVPRGRPITADDSLWNIIGMAQSEAPHDVSANHDKYLAEWELNGQR